MYSVGQLTWYFCFTAARRVLHLQMHKFPNPYTSPFTALIKQRPSISSQALMMYYSSSLCGWNFNSIPVSDIFWSSAETQTEVLSIQGWELYTSLIKNKGFGHDRPTRFDVAERLRHTLQRNCSLWNNSLVMFTAQISKSQRVREEICFGGVLFWRSCKQGSGSKMDIC